MDLAVADGEMLRGLECGYQVPEHVHEKHHHASLSTFMMRSGMIIFLGEMSGSCTGKWQTKWSYRQLMKHGTHTTRLRAIYFSTSTIIDQEFEQSLAFEQTIFVKIPLCT